jgi:nucleoid DNA-binding protein
MEKVDFAKKLADKSQLSEEEASKFIDAFTETLSGYFKTGEKVVIAEFGSFYVNDDKTIRFNPSAKLKELVG